MTSSAMTEQLKRHLSSCPVCSLDVYPDAYAVLRGGEWYHVRCAIEREDREAALKRPHRHTS
jgi:hypothetical protein